MNKCAGITLYTLPGLLLALFFSVIFWIVFPNVIHSAILQNLRLVPGNEIWKGWEKAPIPVYLTFWIQSVKNPDEVENGMQAIFEEKGPYTYLQKLTKVDLKQEDGPNTVKYKQVRTYFFDQKLSGSNMESDLVTIPNLPFISMIYAVRKMIPLDMVAALLGNVILKGEPMLVRNITVDEFLFTGWDVSTFTNSILGRALPKEFSGGRFGLFKGKNGTPSEEWEVYTGVDGIENFGRIKTFNGKRNVGFWRPGTHCDELAGTDGSLLPPFITRETNIYAFGPEVCRALPIVYAEDVEFKGIPAYRFTASSDAFGDPRDTPSNRCFCMEDDVEKCQYRGVMALEPCFKAPLWISPPHFMGADVRYLDSGQEPADEAKHSTFLDIEPTLGLTMRAHKRLQFNIEVNHNRKVHAFQGLTKRTLFPIAWADENAELPDEFVDKLKGQLFTPLYIIGIAKWILLFLGFALSIVGLVYSVHKYFLKKPGQKKKKGIDLTRPSTSSTDSGSAGSKTKKRSAVGTLPPPPPPPPEPPQPEMVVNEEREPSISSASISYID